MLIWTPLSLLCLGIGIAFSSMSARSFTAPSLSPTAQRIAYEYQQSHQAIPLAAPPEIEKPKVSPQERDILVLNAFNEARGESLQGIKAVLGVTMARVESACYPDSIEDVVYQHRQFSWTQQKGTARSLAKAARIDPRALQQVSAVVDQYIADGAKPSQALLYHASHIRPKWSKSPKVTRVKRVGSHYFYDLKNC